jgi:dTDP-glucose 4,6-dehydratase
MPRIVLITGGYGFIGREVAIQCWHRGDHVVVVDACTYAARPELLPDLPRITKVEGDIRELSHLFGADTIVHCAAETHVCNSIDDAQMFVETNILGTFHLLELIRAKRGYERPLFLNVSTDEVFGDVPGRDVSTERDHLLPSSPYSASKAAAELLTMAWARTYGLRIRTVRPSNCYGPGQYPEKLIPKVIRCLQLGRDIPIHGDGSQTRSWLHVEDCARAILAVLDHGQDGDSYNVPGNTAASVRDIVEALVGHYTALTGRPSPSVLSFGQERPGGDTRYCVAGKKIAGLGWRTRGAFWDDLSQILRHELDLGVHVA